MKSHDVTPSPMKCPKGDSEYNSCEEQGVWRLRRTFRVGLKEAAVLISEVQMNAIVSICHFCELHGPSVVFCTQAFRDLLGFNVIADIETSPLENTQNVENEHQTKDGKYDLWKYGRIHQDVVAQARNETPNETCVACRSFPHSKPGYISNDDSARVSYISSQYPLQTELYILVRQACIRSLSCEVQHYGAYEGQNALVKLVAIYCKAPQADHHQSSRQCFQGYSQIYETEESKVSHRALRSAAVMMDKSRKQRVAGQPRSLCEMVGEEGVWQHLHSSFTWLLKASGLRLQERLVEGPPISSFMANCSDECGGLNIQQAYNILGSTIFHHLVHHLLIGRQVILRGNSDVIISALIKSIQPLLPKHCYRAIHFSQHYVDCASCNVLGLHSLVSIPQNVMVMKNLFVIDLIPKGDTGEVFSKTTPRTSSNLLSTQEVIKGDYQNPKGAQALKEIIKNYTIKLSQEGPLPARPPQILSRIESAVSNPTLTYSTLCVYLSTIIYEWINKVKVWIHVQNAKKMVHGWPERVPSPSTLQASNRSSSIPIIQGSSHSLAHSPVISTFRSMSPGGLGERQQEVTHQDEKHQLLAAIGSTEWDVPLLEFWAKNFYQDTSQEMIMQ
ncbi:folliculin-like isoform X2 [Portunus trituberculatus]|uniref:folliculin-like isoform X2 n=1 Tax=Portunus trituberculatus TaxID=210409 RepID=UPI001E1CC2B9|nr:folliculin-like isoform X2 [Portunus trituberculatus]